jgi:hypothetical protein
LWVENYYGLDPQLNYYGANFTSLVSPIANVLPFTTKPGEMTNILIKIHPNVGTAFLFAIAMSTYIFIQQKKINAVADAWLSPLIVTAFFILLFIWSPFYIWGLLPAAFTVGQYSWRLLAQLTWVAALLFALSFAWLFPSGTLTKRNMLLGCFCVIFSTSSWYAIKDVGFTYADFPGMIHSPTFAVSDDTYLLNPAMLSRRSFTVKHTSLPIMTMQESKKYCHQDKDITKCVVPNSTSAKSMILPILYYPALLSITLNGKNIPYQGMLYKEKLFAAIATTPNVVNEIEIKFTGLPLANRISCLSWFLWVMLLFSKLFFVWLYSRKQELALCAK